MEPVISFDAEHAAHEGVPEDARHGRPAPALPAKHRKAPHGKTGSLAASELGEDAEEGEAATHGERRIERRDEIAWSHARPTIICIPRRLRRARWARGR